jgi:hypothetical protein
MNLRKIKLTDRHLWSCFGGILGFIGTLFSIFSIAVDIPPKEKPIVIVCLVVFLVLVYFVIWVVMNRKREISLKINGTTVKILCGDIFEQKDIKVIAFNEYFDTSLGPVITEDTLNGQFIKRIVNVDGIDNLDARIASDETLASYKTDINENRQHGKKQKYKLGSIYRYNGDFLLTAFTKFDEADNAFLYLPDYLTFLTNFWTELNKLYNGKDVCITIFGSGITRFRGVNKPSNQTLLELIIWSFRSMGITFSSQIKIVLYGNIVDEIDFYKLKEF